MFTYILYQKRSIIKATFTFDHLRNRSKSYFITEVFGLSFCISALLIYWYGSYTFSPLEYHLLTLPLFLAGTILVLFDFETLTALLFPILILLLLIPIPSEITYVAGAGVGNINTQASYLLLSTIGVPVSLDSTFVSKFIRATAALSNQNTFTFECVGGNGSVIVGHSNINTNRISISVDCKCDSDVKPISFSAEFLKEILNSNTDANVAKLKISTQGLAHLHFEFDSYTTDYYLVEIQK